MIRLPKLPPFSLRGTLQRFGLVFLLGIFVVVIAIRQPSFLDQRNLSALIYQWSPVGIMAVGGTFVIIAGGFDLSIGGIYAAATVIAAALATRVPLPIAFLLTVAAGMAAGVINGLIITKARVNAFIATFGSGQVFTGFALAATAATPIVVTSTAFGWLGQSKIGSIPLDDILLVAFFIVGGVVLAVTVFGRTVYAIGGNRESSILSGLNADLIQIGTYVISGGTAAFAGMMFASRIGEGQASLGGTDIVFQVITAIILGGTALSGGVGSMWRTAIGFALLAVTYNGLDALAINPFYIDVVIGSILVGAVAWDEYARRRTVGSAQARRFGWIRRSAPPLPNAPILPGAVTAPEQTTLSDGPGGVSSVSEKPSTNA
jgi:ribose transport system permease protein